MDQFGQIRRPDRLFGAGFVKIEVAVAGIAPVPGEQVEMLRQLCGQRRQHPPPLASAGG